MSTDDFSLINDHPAPAHHASTRHHDTDPVTTGDYYTSYADSDPDKSLLPGAPTTPSSKRTNHHQNYYYAEGGSIGGGGGGGSKRQRASSVGESSEANVNPNSSDYRGSGGGGGGDYRKDREEWSDTAIARLLEAYTEKYNQLNRGNLRGRDWEEVAEAVSERGGGGGGGSGGNKKSVEQCKNKIDNLKKRYKVELQRISGSGCTSWHWYKQIECIMGNSSSTKGGSVVATAGGVEGDGGCGGGNTGNSGSVTIRQAKRYASGNSSFASNVKPKSSPNLRWRRVVFKVSGAALTGNCPNIDPKVALQIAREVATAIRVGLEVAIVVGGRNFFCGASWVSTTGLEKPIAYQIGQMATVMNSILLQSALEKLGVQSRVQSAFAMPELVEPYCRQKAVRHLEKGRVVIFGGICAGSGNPLFTTDTAAALRASEINADALLKGTNMDGVYECHSGNNVLLDHISFRDAASRGVPSMDMMAISYCEENNIPVVIFNLLEPGNISRALCGDQIGTLIDQTERIS